MQQLPAAEGVIGDAGTAPPPRWPRFRIAAWVLIALGVVAFIVAGDVRTNWVVGDVAPDLGEVALPRLGTISLMAGLVLLAWHQVRARRWLPDDRYRGPSVLILLALIIGLSVLVVLPVRESVNHLIEGGTPDPPPLLIWMLGTQLSLLAVSWLILRTRPMPGLRLFSDHRPIRHALIGVGAGIAVQVVTLLVAATLERVTGGPIFQIAAEGLGDLAPSGVPAVVAIAISVGLAPVAEEIFFRGIALPAWLREHGLWPALIGSSVLFGLAHYGLNPVEGFLPEVPRLAVLSAGGLVLGLLAVRTGSLIAPIAAHASMNAFILLLGLLLI